jgi:dihydrofolate synthase/folylpolyglutamate synthase
MSSTYQEALAWLYAFSDFERTGTFNHDREDNLRREAALLTALGDPHRAYGVTHVAGTKGKGSTATLIASVLRASGRRVGLYTQPDLHTFRERIQVDGQPIAEADIAALVPELRAAVEGLGATHGTYITYEVATALAFLAFARAGVDHAVIEVGLGGRLDATNVVQPRVAVITSISYDHMQVLGNTLGAIAREKAGIIKPGAPTVCSAQAPEALAVIREVAAARGSRLITVGPDGSASDYTYRAGAYTSERQAFSVRGPDGVARDFTLTLLGEHQLENAAAAVAAVDALRTSGVAVDDAALRDGLAAARWPARLQVVGERPWLVVDGAHNADSLARLLAALRRHFTYGRLALVLGLMADKDLAGIAREIAQDHVALVVTTAARNPRAMAPERIVAALAEAAPGLAVQTAPGIAEAVTLALGAMGPGDLLCVTGSLYLAGEALRHFVAHGGAERMRPIAIAGVDQDH